MALCYSTTYPNRYPLFHNWLVLDGAFLPYSNTCSVGLLIQTLLFQQEGSRPFRAGIQFAGTGLRSGYDGIPSGSRFPVFVNCTCDSPVASLILIYILLYTRSGVYILIRFCRQSNRPVPTIREIAPSGSNSEFLTFDTVGGQVTEQIVHHLTRCSGQGYTPVRSEGPSDI